MADALCREYPGLDFIDERNERVRAKALQVCGRCAVRPECLAYALADSTLIGIFGGCDTAARRAIRRNRKQAT